MRPFLFFMSEQKEMGAAERLRQHVKNMEQTVVSVTAPSGFVYKFLKPSKFATLFQLGQLPQAAASKAVERWIAAGVIKEGDAQPEAIKDLNMVDQILDRLLHLSFEPKIVLSDPKNDNEVTTDLVPPDDLEYLFTWVAAGGEVSGMLSTFPRQTNGSALVSHSRKKQRAAAK